ncbi:sigma-70 family RNA polymerase sigma factor [Flammeovirgaceae bacterium SG7u.111]|nr:sigma-70 family RNA polymerase sigma factor [Flammeovirgaceae bacterium SG7u.132]WPO36459.1 sigma-70 family RNA polymerase sigma factor [Flammeovirgaceae bacterium SG7u.111]
MKMINHSDLPKEVSLYALPPNPEAKKNNPSLHGNEFWEDFCNGKAEAINFIYQRNIDWLFNYGCQLCRDPELVKDCIQDVFIQLIKYQKNIKPVVSGRAYLLKALQREVFRKKKSLSKKSTTTLAEGVEFGISLPQEMKIIEDQLTKEKKALINSGLKQLSKKQREAITLYYIEGFSYEEIAYIMELKLTKSARKLIYKAIASLKASVKETKSKMVSPLSALYSILF